MNQISYNLLTEEQSSYFGERERVRGRMTEKVLDTHWLSEMVSNIGFTPQIYNNNKEQGCTVEYIYGEGHNTRVKVIKLMRIR